MASSIHAYLSGKSMLRVTNAIVNLEYGNQFEDRITHQQVDVEYAPLHKDAVTFVGAQFEYIPLYKSTAHAYILGFEWLSDIPAFTTGSSHIVSAFMHGCINPTASTPALTHGGLAVTPTVVHAYMDVLDNSLIRQEINILDGIVSASGDCGALIYYDSALYSALSEVKFEVVGKVDSGTCTVTLRDAAGNVHATADIAGSSYEIYSITPSTTLTTDTYKINLSGGTGASILSAKVVITQSPPGDLYVTSTQIEIGNQEVITSLTDAPLVSPKYWKYDSSKYDPEPVFTASVAWRKIDTAAVMPYVVTNSNVWYDCATSSFVLYAPAGSLSTDIQLLICETDNTDITPTGAYLTQIASTPIGTSLTDATRITAWWRRYVSSVIGIGTPSNHATACLITIRDAVISGTPYECDASATDVVSDTSGSIPGGTTTTDNELIIGAASCGKDTSSTAYFSAWTNANLGSVTEILDFLKNTGNGGGLGVFSGTKATAGTYGNTAVTYAAANVKALFSLAFKGKIDTTPTATIKLQESDGTGDGFTGWADKVTIVNASAVSNTDTLSTISFTPVNGRAYRIVASTSSTTGHSVQIYNAKIIATQSALASTTYYFDAHDGSEYDTGLWAWVSNLFDSSDTTYCYGNGSTFPTSAILGKGTSAPSTNTTIIVNVKSQLKAANAGNYTDNGTWHYDISTPNLAETLAYDAPHINAGDTWSPLILLSAPIGGWTWASLHSLWVRMAGGNGSFSSPPTVDRTYIVNLEVWYGNGRITKLETQYLIANTKLDTGTSRQPYLVKYNVLSWRSNNTYTHMLDAANGSASDANLQENTGSWSDIANSTVSNPDNQGVSSSFSLVNSNLSVIATDNDNDIYASRLIVTVNSMPSGLPSSSRSVAYTQGGTAVTPGQTPAYTFGNILRKNFQAAFVEGDTGPSGVWDNQRAYTHGLTGTNAVQWAYIVSGFYRGSKHVWVVVASDVVRSSVSVYINSILGASTQQSAFLEGYATVSHVDALTWGGATTKSILHSYVQGDLPRSSVSAFTDSRGEIKSYGHAYTSANFKFAKTSAYLFGNRERTGLRHAYIEGIYGNQSDSSASAYSYGLVAYRSTKSSYVCGGTTDTNTHSGFLAGNIFTRDNQSAYIGPAAGTNLASLHGYCIGKIKSSVHGYVTVLGEADPMAAVDYIWLQTSDGGATKSSKFRVLAQDYDDGTEEKAESVDRTIGGGIDHSVGAIYKTWSPIIRVRHTETESGFGSVADLEYFYELNNPNSVPSNDITFIDHHQTSYTVHIIGKMTKNLMGCSIEGTEAWFLYRVQFIRIA